MTKRLFLEPSDLMILEGTTEKTARRDYLTYCILLEKISEAKAAELKVNSPGGRFPRDQRPRITIAEYAAHVKADETYIRNLLPDEPGGYKNLNKRA